MGLGIKSTYEEKTLEFLPDDIYCSRMISEVLEWIPKKNYTYDVMDIARKLGREVFPDEIRDTKTGRSKNRFIAYCINVYGRSLKDKRK